MQTHSGHCPKTIKGGQDSTCTCYRDNGRPKSFHENYEKYPVELDPNLGLHSTKNL
ncbi:hypothetical protein SEA_THUNDERCLAP_12 [Arthrobacter phage Thunderclap]|uniref:Uncharacterized protein n=1 Tax=Arthrobacter phage Thunderclap TaxID=2777309 RepID=A0A7M1RQ74_9CAUD|nr:hypothetical protein SEA_THUNDERCLAP_12 [Arthrobacter phage Thunderclap]